MNPVTGLSLARIGLGATALVSPRIGSKLFQLDADTNPQLPYMVRLFGSREVALGVMTLLAPEALRPRLITLGIAVDGADAVAGLAAGVSGSVSAPTSALLAAPAIAAIAAGVQGLRPTPRV